MNQKQLSRLTPLILCALFLCVATQRALAAEMVTVPGGTFPMGCTPQSDPDCFESEQPEHSVQIETFQIDKHEVTYARYQLCVDAGICEPLGMGGACNAGWDGIDDLPVNCVTWYNAKTFCEWEGKRLPTEAEWEKAARGTTGNIYPWGNESPSCERAVMDSPDGGNLGCGTGAPMPVGSKPKGASPYGAMDMAGSMWEWTSDWYGHFYYYESPTDNPKGPSSGDYKVARGGDLYARKNAELRSATRFFYAPANYSPAIAFRCVR